MQLQKQAEHAIRLYFAWVQSSKRQQDFNIKDRNPLSTPITPNTRSDNRQEYRSFGIESQQPEAPAAKKRTVRQRGTDWTGVFEDLNNTIRIRHYSLATSKIYTSWVRKFQAFTESKDPTIIGTEDVKQFLSLLAVKNK